MRRFSGVALAAAVIAVAAGLYELREREARRQRADGAAILAARELKGLDFTAQPSATPADAAFQRGVAAFNADDAETAADAFEEAVRLAPTSADAHTNLGLVYLRLNRDDDGLRELEKALALQPRSVSAQLGIGKCYAKRGNVAKALQVFRRVVSSAPGSREAIEAQSLIDKFTNHES
jgi:Tfp pilus assembly protein PilF